MKTSQKQISLFTEEKLTSSPEVFPANPTVQQAKERAKKMRDISGLKCLGQLERLSPGTSWAKTFLGYLVGQGDWFSTRCKLTWKMKGTKYNRVYFQLQVSTRPTKETEFGLLLSTPSATPAANITQERAKELGWKWRGTSWEDAKGVQKNTNLIHQIQMGMLPSPVASDATTGAIIGKNDKFVITKTGMPRKINQKGTDGSVGLARLGKLGMLPTPTAQCSKGGRKGTNPRKGVNPLTNNLGDTINFINQTSKSSHLKPQFVMEMMGFPPDWTLLPFLNGEPKASKEVETQ